jgi:hypothetical protein
MIVQRIYVKVKPGCNNALLTFLKASRARMNNPRNMRILKPMIGQSRNTIVYELTNKDLAENQKDWQEWLGRTETPDLLERWDQLVEDWSDEFWDVEI